MSQIRALAGQSPTGADFKARVEIGLGTLARDAENQIVVVSSTRTYSTVVDRSVLGTTDAMAYQRWISQGAVNRVSNPWWGPTAPTGRKSPLSW
jgi:hypothetical protein